MMRYLWKFALTAIIIYALWHYGGGEEGKSMGRHFSRGQERFMMFIILIVLTLIWMAVKAITGKGKKP